MFISDILATGHRQPLAISTSIGSQPFLRPNPIGSQPFVRPNPIGSLPLATPQSSDSIASLLRPSPIINFQRLERYTLQKCPHTLRSLEGISAKI